MKKLILAAAALMIVVGAQAQGYFTFNTRPDAQHVIKFVDASGVGLSGPNYFVQVFAGATANSLVPLAGPLPLNRTGTGAGLTNPFLTTYTTAIAVGTAYIGYQAFQGTDFATATAKSAMITTMDGGASATPLTVALATAPALPNEVSLGNGTVSLVPEPTTLALGLLGLGSLLVIRRRK